MYVVVRIPDVGPDGDVTVAAFEDEVEADKLAKLGNAADGDAYQWSVEFVPVEAVAEEAWKEINS
jgi:hypothetical protein